MAFFLFWSVASGAVGVGRRPPTLERRRRCWRRHRPWLRRAPCAAEQAADKLFASLSQLPAAAHRERARAVQRCHVCCSFLLVHPRAGSLYAVRCVKTYITKIPHARSEAPTRRCRRTYRCFFARSAHFWLWTSRRSLQLRDAVAEAVHNVPLSCSRPRFNRATS